MTNAEKALRKLRDDLEHHRSCDLITCRNDLCKVSSYCLIREHIEYLLSVVEAGLSGDPRPTEPLDSDVVLEPGVSISNHDPAETKPTMTITGLGTGATRPTVELDSDGRPIGRT